MPKKGYDPFLMITLTKKGSYPFFGRQRKRLPGLGTWRATLKGPPSIMRLREGSAPVRRIVGWIALAAALVVAPRAQQPADAPADLVFVNGKVLTVDAADSVARGVAIRNGTIAAVGSVERVRSLVGPATRVIDLGGRTMTPGLIDSHVHFSEAAAMLVTAKVPPLAREQEKSGIRKLAADFNREGMTGAKDPGIGEAKWELYQELLREGTLTVRVFALWSGGRSVDATRRLMTRI